MSCRSPIEQAVARERVAVGLDVEVIAAGHALGIGAGRAGNVVHHRLDLLRDLLEFRQVLAEHLDADRRADAGRQHVDARLDRHGPGIGDTRKLQRLVHLRDQLSVVMPGRHSSFGLRLMTVSNISIGAGSVAVRRVPPCRTRIRLRGSS